MQIKDLIKQLENMRLLYGDKIILTITDGESEYSIKDIKGNQCAKFFKPADKVAEVIINLKTLEQQPSISVNPTNGDMILSLYPNLRYSIQNNRIVTTIGVASSFDLEWWNTPYRKKAR